MTVDTSTVRVEYSHPDYDTYISDNRGEGGGAGWFMPAGGKSYKRSEYKINELEWTLDGGTGGPGPYMVFDTTGTGGTVYSRFYDIHHNAGGQVYISMWVGRISTSPTVTITMEVYDDAANVISSTFSDGGDTELSATATGWTRLGGYFSFIAAGGRKVRIKLTGVGVYAVRDVRIKDANFDNVYFTGSDYDPDSYNTQPNIRSYWFDITANATSIGIRRGLRPNPPVDQLEIGTATIRFKTKPTSQNRTLYGDIRPGFMVRVRGKVGTEWETVFQGRLVEIVDIEALGDEPAFTEYRIQDRVSELVGSSVSTIEGTNVGTRLESVVNPDPGNRKGPAIRVIGVDSVPHMNNEAAVVMQQGNTLDHLLTIRNTDFGLLWCDKTNQLQYVSGGGVQSTTVPEPRSRPTYVFRTSDKWAPFNAGEKSPILAGWDREQSNTYNLNTVTVNRIWVANGAAQAESSQWAYTTDVYSRGLRQGDVNVINSNVSSMAYAYAKDYLNAFNEWPRSIDEFWFNADKDVATAATFDIYDSIRVRYNEALYGSADSGDTMFRIIGLEHDITPGRWRVKVSVRKKERRVGTANPPADPDPIY